jgi:hypothetical protein
MYLAFPRPVVLNLLIWRSSCHIMYANQRKFFQNTTLCRKHMLKRVFRLMSKIFFGIILLFYRQDFFDLKITSPQFEYIAKTTLATGLDIIQLKIQLSLLLHTKFSYTCDYHVSSESLICNVIS